MTHPNFQVCYPLHITVAFAVGTTTIQKPIEILSDHDIAALTADLLGGQIDFGCFYLFADLKVFQVQVAFTEHARLENQDLKLPAGRHAWNPLENHAQFEFLMRVVHERVDQYDRENSREFRKTQLVELLKENADDGESVAVIQFVQTAHR